MASAGVFRVEFIVGLGGFGLEMLEDLYRLC